MNENKVKTKRTLTAWANEGSWFDEYWVNDALLDKIYPTVPQKINRWPKGRWLAFLKEIDESGNLTPIEARIILNWAISKSRRS